MKKATESKEGARYLRELVEFLNSRGEFMNDGKSARQLMNDFNKAIRITAK